MVQDEQAERFVLEDDRDEADGRDPGVRVACLEGGRGALTARVVDEDGARLQGPDARRLRGRRQTGDRLEHFGGDAPVGGEREREAGVLVVVEQPGAVDVEQGERVVEDVLEERREVRRAADLRRDAPQGVRPRRRVGDEPERLRGRGPAAGGRPLAPGAFLDELADVRPPDASLAATVDAHRSQPARRAPRPDRVSMDAGQLGRLRHRQELGVAPVEGDHHRAAGPSQGWHRRSASAAAGDDLDGRPAGVGGAIAQWYQRVCVVRRRRVRWAGAGAAPSRRPAGSRGVAGGPRDVGGSRRRGGPRDVGGSRAVDGSAPRAGPKLWSAGSGRPAEPPAERSRRPYHRHSCCTLRRVVLASS